MSAPCARRTAAERTAPAAVRSRSLVYWPVPAGRFGYWKLAVPLVATLPPKETRPRSARSTSPHAATPRLARAFQSLPPPRAGSPGSAPGPSRRTHKP